jgi:hypothetical protein
MSLKSKNQPRIEFRLKPPEVIFYRRMADYFWRSGTIPQPTLSALGRACLNILGNKWAKLEEENHNAYVSRLEEARAGGGVSQREMYNPRYRQLPPDPYYSRDYDPLATPWGSAQSPQRRRPIPPELRKDAPIERTSEDWF